MIANTVEIQRALAALLRDKGLTQAQLAQKLGVSPSTTGAWVNGKAMSIYPRHWSQLYPMLEPYLPRDLMQGDGGRFPVTDFYGLAIASVSMAKLASYHPAVSSVEDFMGENSEGKVTFQTAQRGDVAVTVDTDGMLPHMPRGTVLLCRPGDIPRNWDIVVAKLSNGEVMVREYHRDHNAVLLELLPGCHGLAIEWDMTAQPGLVVWMWRVIASYTNIADRQERVRKERAAP